VDWARVLLDPNTEDMIINVSREKIAHEIIRLRALASQSGNRSVKSYDSNMLSRGLRSTQQSTQKSKS